eukprot:2341895-Pleurochrysis_carterae.AAC.1
MANCSASRRRRILFYPGRCFDGVCSSCRDVNDADAASSPTPASLSGEKTVGSSTVSWSTGAWVKAG